MSLKITNDVIRSDQTKHIAARVTDQVWVVTWLPGRRLTRDQAIAAMTIAERVGIGLEPGDAIWPQIDGWAATLGLTGPAAVVQVSAFDPIDGDQWG